MYLVISNKLNNELKKSLGNNSKLDYFKNKLLAILDKKEKEEEKEFHKSWDDIELMQKSRAMPVGTIQTWKGKKFKKMPNKKWVRVYDTRNRSAEISIARLKGKVRRATSVDELFEIVSNNIHRFEDENGRTLDIVQELKAEVDKAKGVINKDKPKFDYEGNKWNKYITPINKEAEDFVNSEVGKNATYDKLPPNLLKTFNVLKYYAKTQPKGLMYDFKGMGINSLRRLVNAVNFHKKYTYNTILQVQKGEYETIENLLSDISEYNDMLDRIKKAKNWIEEKEKPKEEKIEENNDNNKSELDEEIEFNTNGKTYNNLNFDTLPEALKREGTAKKTFTNVCNYINSLEIKDTRIKTILDNFSYLVENRMNLFMGKSKLNIVPSFPDDDYCYYPQTNWIHIPPIEELKTKKDVYHIQTVLHEFGHCIDRSLLLTDEETKIAEKPFRGKKIHELPPKIKEYFEPYFKYDEKGKTNYSRIFNKIQKQVWDREIKVDDANAKLKKIRKNLTSWKIKCLSDIYDALSGGDFLRNNIVELGHGKKYTKIATRTSETFANYFVLKVMLPDQLKVLQEDQPQLCEAFENLLDKCMERLKVLKSYDV